jgi:hypothetical protein
VSLYDHVAKRERFESAEQKQRGIFPLGAGIFAVAPTLFPRWHAFAASQAS